MENILFLHGWGGDEKSFAGILPFFRTKYNCVCLNMPREPETPWTLEDYADLVFKELDRQGISRTHIIAHSFGARVAVLLLILQPGRFGKVVLTGPAGIRPRFNLWRRFRILFHKAGIIKSKGSKDYRILSPSGKVTFQKIVNRDLKPEISQITHPSLILWGRHDKAVKKYMVKRWTKLNNSTKIKCYGNSGHFCFLDEPAQFIMDTEEFFCDF